MGSPGADELALGQSCQSSSSLHLSPPWPWPPLSLMRPRHPAPTPRLQLTPGTAITAMEDTGEDTEATMAGLMASADPWYGYYGYGGYRGYYGGYARPYGYYGYYG